MWRSVRCTVSSAREFVPSDHDTVRRCRASGCGNLCRRPQPPNSGSAVSTRDCTTSPTRTRSSSPAEPLGAGCASGSGSSAASSSTSPERTRLVTRANLLGLEEVLDGQHCALGVEPSERRPARPAVARVDVRSPVLVDHHAHEPLERLRYLGGLERAGLELAAEATPRGAQEQEYRDSSLAGLLEGGFTPFVPLHRGSGETGASAPSVGRISVKEPDSPPPS